MDSSMGEPAFVREAKAIMLQTVRLFGLEGTCLSFNGGKDSTVLLHLMRATFPESYQHIPVIFFQQKNEFPEVDAFVRESVERYNLKIIYMAESFKDGLKRLMAETKIKAIFLGTRAGDPHSAKLEIFSPTDPGWPAFMRVHPILKWTYAEVWEYLQPLPFCCLYNQGYTSLGSTRDTERNKMLVNEHGQYRPARELCDGKYERCGRPGYSYDLPHTAAIVRLFLSPFSSSSSSSSSSSHTPSISSVSSPGSLSSSSASSTTSTTSTSPSLSHHSHHAPSTTTSATTTTTHTHTAIATPTAPTTTTTTTGTTTHTSTNTFTTAATTTTISSSSSSATLIDPLSLPCSLAPFFSPAAERVLTLCQAVLQQQGIALEEVLNLSGSMKLTPSLAYLCKRHDLVLLLSAQGDNMDQLVAAAEADADYAPLLRHSAVVRVDGDSSAEEIAATIAHHCTHLK